jgi:hypothetical protein
MTESETNHAGVFLLGVGAQKAGTSWLHQQLHSRHDADFGCLKEYHVHDARTVKELARFRTCKVDWRRPRTWLQPRSRLRQWFIHSPERYTDYFQWLLTRPRLRGAQIQLTGDITPSYAVLTADTFREIKTSFEKRSIPVKPVFLMRDPIERMISSQRMKLRKLGVRDASTEISTLRQRVQKGRGLRSDYGHTLDALTQAFGLDNCHIGLFETLFRADTYATLCNYLQIPYQEPAWNQKVNVSATANVIPEDLLAEMGAQQALNLQRARAVLPEVNFDRLWPTASRWCQP